MRRQPYGWAGDVQAFLNEPSPVVVSKLEQHLWALLGQAASGSQQQAWKEEERLLRASLRDLAVGRPDVLRWGITLEYELHLEGGRRPDVIIHTGKQLVVLEFKQDFAAQPGAIDQVSAYARDLSEYHRASHGMDIRPVLVLTRSDLRLDASEEADVISPMQLSALLADERLGSGPDNFDEWLQSPYEPLPTLVEAARMIFREEPLPNIRRAESAGIPEAVALLTRLAKEAERDSQRVLALLAGVPGAGKTLTGLQLVYDRLADDHDSVFLSGNGPLVQVLRDALKSKTFVQDLHAFVTTFGNSTRAPQHHIVVFDEAQRAWDRGYMQHNGRGENSEPDVLIRVGERLPRWSTLVGLVGDGQEIHSGEEAGLGQWRTAIQTQATEPWLVHCAPRVSQMFEGLNPTEHDELDLTLSLRSRRAEELHAWVAALLEGRLGDAARLSRRVQSSGFPMYLTRDLAAAKHYILARYEDEPERRYGILASSRTQRFLPEFGVDSSWPATKKVNFGRWYNRPRGEEGAGGNFESVVTEFGCQGLELDLPLVAWGDDVRWDGAGWQVKPGRPRYPQEDPIQLRINCYRVLLTRGRDGLVVYIPAAQLLDQTEHALLAAGVVPLPDLDRRGEG